MFLTEREAQRASLVDKALKRWEYIASGTLEPSAYVIAFLAGLSTVTKTELQSAKIRMKEEKHGNNV
jgi:hypothetical protein